MPGHSKLFTKHREMLFLLIAVMFCFFKHSLVVSLPVEARYYTTDDYLMVQMAEGLLQGEWLGTYSPVNLMKGSFFPIFLAGTARFGSSYLSMLDFANTMACLFFAYQMRYLFQNKKYLFVLFIVLLFEPCSYSQMTFQRVYRSSVTEMQVLFLFGSYFGFYLLIKTRRSSGKWDTPVREGVLSLICGIALWSIWNTREESMWLIPFVGTATILITVELLLAIRKSKRQSVQISARLICLFLPILLLVIGNRWIRWENERYYGAAIRLEEVDGEFADALRTIYSIKNEVEIPYVTVSREKVERLYTVSDSLRQIRPELEKNIDRYSGADRHPGDGEVEDGWFFWGLKRAPYESGIADTLPKSQAFWKQVRLELEDALNTPENGLERQSVMPSALISPWRKEYLSELPEATWKAIRYMISYEENAPLIEASGKASDSVSRHFETITNNLVVYHDQDNKMQRQLLDPIAAKLNRIISIYRTINPVIAVISFILYLVFLIISIRKKSKEQIPLLLIVTGMQFSAFVVIFGTAYTHISAFPSIRYYYLVGAYPLMLASEWVIILYTVELLLSKLRNSKGKNTSQLPHQIERE